MAIYIKFYETGAYVKPDNGETDVDTSLSDVRQYIQAYTTSDFQPGTETGIYLTEGTITSDNIDFDGNTVGGPTGEYIESGNALFIRDIDGPLDDDTEYSWDCYVAWATDPSGDATRGTYTFTTGGGGGGGATKPTNPSPVHESGPGIDFSDFTFTWVDGGSSDSFNVYLGSSPYSLNLHATITDAYYTPAVASQARAFLLAVQDVIYWRVDAVEDGDTATGDVWSFDPRPAAVTNPSPSDEATDGRLNTTQLSWDASTYADTYNVYFTGYLAPVSVAQAGVTCSISWGPLDYDTEYTWRVDSTNQFGTTEGTEWTFTTLAFDGPWVSARSRSDGSVVSPTDFDFDTMYYTGENFFAGGMGRLVIAADNSIWYETVDDT